MQLHIFCCFVSEKPNWCQNDCICCVIARIESFYQQNHENGNLLHEAIIIFIESIKNMGCLRLLGSHRCPHMCLGFIAVNWEIHMFCGFHFD